MENLQKCLDYLPESLAGSVSAEHASRDHNNMDRPSFTSNEFDEENDAENSIIFEKPSEEQKVSLDSSGSQSSTPLVLVMPHR